KNPWRPVVFQPLMAAYLFTGDRRYLEKWIDYMDDWALHEFVDAEIRPADLPDSTNGYLAQAPALLQALAVVARTPQAAEFPADTLARLIRKLVVVYPLPALVYFESNPQNWTPHTMVGFMRNLLLLSEFKA